MELNQAFVGQKVAYRGQQHEIHALGTTPSGGGLAWLQGVTSPAPLCDVEPMLEHVPLFVQAEKSPQEQQPSEALDELASYARYCLETMDYAHTDTFLNLPYTVRRELAGKYHIICIQSADEKACAREAIYEAEEFDKIVEMVGWWTKTNSVDDGRILLSMLATAITDYHAPAIQRIIDGEKL